MLGYPLDDALQVAADQTFDYWFFTNRILDVVFLMDLLLQFNLAFANKQGTWIKDRTQICLHYLSSWFLMDLVAQVPLVFEISAVGRVGDDKEGSSGQSVTLLRIVRVVRLIKLARLLRTSRVLNRWKSRLTISHSTVRVRPHSPSSHSSRYILLQLRHALPK